jgi:hypothetical protein
MEIQIQITQSFIVPDGTVALEAPSGVVTELRLPSGEVIKPWITLELVRNANGEEAYADLKTEALEALDIHEPLDRDVAITGCQVIERTDGGAS